MSVIDDIESALGRMSNDELFEIVCEVSALVEETALPDADIVRSVRVALARYGLYEGGT